MDGELHGAMHLGCAFLTDNEELDKGLLEKKEFCHKETIDELYPGLIDAAVKARQEVEGADLVCETIFFIDKKVQARTSKAFGARGSNWYYLKGDKREVDAITKRLNELNVETVPLRETLIEAIAAACHQQNRIWCLAHHDESQSMWLDEPDWQRDSVIAGVKGALAGNTPEQSHEGWLKLKREEGWSYGPEKNVEMKTHPCMLPYGDLPEEHKIKDTFFITTVQQIGKVLGLL
jgi:hypothetical protein